MCKLHIAIAVPLFALGVSVPAWGQGANQQIDPTTNTPQPRQLDQQQPGADTPSSTDASGKRQAQPKKHPPTSTMDKAMSPQKSGDQPKSEDQSTTTGPAGESQQQSHEGSSGQKRPKPAKHPPTSTMDKAMSPQKSGDQPKSPDEPTTTR